MIICPNTIKVIHTNLLHLSINPIDLMRIPYNYVYIKPDPTDEIVLPTGEKLFLATNFEETAHAPSTGTVLCVPEKLRFDRENGTASMNFEVDIELEVGDKVVFHYLTQENAKLDGREMEEGFLVRYDQLYLAIRKDQVICLNGYIIVEPESALIKTKLFLPDQATLRKAKQTGVVRYAGAPVRNYLHPTHFSSRNEPIYPPGDEPVAVGDRICFSHYDAVPLQQDSYIHGVLSKSILYKMQHRDVLGILEPTTEILEYAN